MEQGYWFTSDKFEILPGEDEETNQGCYGKVLAQWLDEQLSLFGYETEVIAEDWGWCVMCQSTDFLLWVGCGAMQRELSVDSADPPSGRDVTWHAFPVLEVPLFFLKSTVRRFTGRLDTVSPLKKLSRDLKVILSSEPRIVLSEEPADPEYLDGSISDEEILANPVSGMGLGAKITVALLASLSGLIMALWASTAPGNVYFNSVPAAFCFVIVGACILPKPISGYLGDVISVCVIALAVMFLVESLPNPKEGENPIGFAIVFGGAAVAYLSRRYGHLVSRNTRSKIRAKNE